jgi:hypothetical protein
VFWERGKFIPKSGQKFIHRDFLFLSGYSAVPRCPMSLNFYFLKFDPCQQHLSVHWHTGAKVIREDPSLTLSTVLLVAEPLAADTTQSWAVLEAGGVVVAPLQVRGGDLATQERFDQVWWWSRNLLNLKNSSFLLPNTHFYEINTHCYSVKLNKKKMKSPPKWKKIKNENEMKWLFVGLC